MSIEALIVALIVGAPAGWFAGKVAQGSGLGGIANSCIGVVGGAVSLWLLSTIGVSVGGYTSASIGAALIGAALSFWLFRLAHRYRHLLRR